MYGGLGKVGLDYMGKKGQENLLDDDDEEGGENSGKNNANANDYVVPAFSAQAKQLIKAKLRAAAASGGDEAEGDENNWEDDDDEEMLVDNIEQM